MLTNNILCACMYVCLRLWNQNKKYYITNEMADFMVSLYIYAAACITSCAVTVSLEKSQLLFQIFCSWFYSIYWSQFSIKLLLT